MHAPIQSGRCNLRNRAEPLYSVCMPRFTAEQIYAYARQAGFSPDQATTMTAIAMAESGGDSRSHATVGEDSQGLWQVNALAHPDLATRFNLYDPAQNAQAAFIVSKGGADVSPWSVTHGGLSARYLRFKDEAQSAAAAYGDGPNHGVWTGNAGYGHPMSAGDPHGGRGAGAPSTDGGDPHGGRGAGAPSTEGSDAVVAAHGPAGLGTIGGGHGRHHAPGDDFGVTLEQDSGTEFGIPLESLSPDAAGADAVGTLTTGAGGGVTAAGTAPGGAAPGGAAPAGAQGDHLNRFLSSAQAQSGDQYIFGVMDRLDDPNPKAFDCSMLVEWSAHQAGVDLPRNAWDQYRFLHEHGAVIPVDQAIHTPGALLFSFNTDPNGSHAPVQQHVAISLGNGKTIEARGSQYPVGSFDATPKRFQYAAVIPGISDQVGPVGPMPDTDAVGGIPVGWPNDPTHPAPPPAADPHPNDPHPGGPTDPAAPHITNAAPIPGGGPPPPPGSGPGNQFNDLLAFDPDQLDSGGHPGGATPPPGDPHGPPDPHGTDPHGAPPPPPPPPPPHEPLYFTLVDANSDGLDDSLEQAGGTPGTHPVEDHWYHDHGGHGGHS
jgi:cell wall-associated NlpC family hydrolase